MQVKISFYAYAIKYQNLRYWASFFYLGYLTVNHLMFAASKFGNFKIDIGVV